MALEPVKSSTAAKVISAGRPVEVVALPQALTRRLNRIRPRASFEISSLFILLVSLISNVHHYTKDWDADARRFFLIFFIICGNLRAHFAAASFFEFPIKSRS